MVTGTEYRMEYSARMEFRVTRMPIVQVRTLSVHESRMDNEGQENGVNRSPRKRHDLYLEIPGMLLDRSTGRSRPHTLTVLLGEMAGRGRSWRPEPGLLEWMKRRGNVRRESWTEREELRLEVSRLARWDHLGAAREALEAIRTTTA